METKDIFKTPSEITVLPHKVGISSDFNSIENDPVHDGSSSITCFLEEDCFGQHQDENYERFQEQEKSSDNIFQAATVILFSSLHYLSSRFFLKHPNSVMRGDIVLLEGKLSQHKGKFNVFVTKLNKKTMNEFIEFSIRRKMNYEDFSVT
ncbi:uncharacterized protein isoform X2 [Leptinotarsa decemlineata]|uniref:uncharacterized protein isoform X2 n=1 Tax=Leptinotarsa decemlineata TaxID=7539 RepID=UPI003D309E80